MFTVKRDICFEGIKFKAGEPVPKEASPRILRMLNQMGLIVEYVAPAVEPVKAPVKPKAKA